MNHNSGIVGRKNDELKDVETFCRAQGNYRSDDNILCVRHYMFFNLKILISAVLNLQQVDYYYYETSCHGVLVGKH